MRIVSGMHFEQMASEYAGARPPYPEVVFDALQAAGVIGRGLRVLEIGAGAGLATREIAARGSEVMALEPGPGLAALLSGAAPDVEVVVARLEDAQLPDQAFHSAVAATAMHWIDLSVGLPILYRALRPHGWLAVWRTIFEDDAAVGTRFRAEVDRIVSRRDKPQEAPGGGERPSIEELATGGLFEPVRTRRWRWSIELSAEQVHRLFRTFSDWSPEEAQAAAEAAEALGGRVSEHYQSVLHLLRRAP
jgi:SAM-dependent methyltransferase